MGLFSRKPPPIPDALPSGPWAILHGKQGDSVMIIRVNTGAQAIAGHPRFDHRAGFATRCATTTANPTGLPSVEENAELQEVEERLDEALRGDREALMVLAITGGGVKEWVFYTADPESTKRRALEFVKTVTSHKLQFYIKPDPGWEAYRKLSQP